MLQGPKWNAFREIVGVIQALTIIAGVVFTLFNLRIATESLTQTKTINSAAFMIEISKRIEGPRYEKILAAIEDHASTFPLLSTRSKRRFSDEQIENYIGTFETLGILTDAKIVDPNMVYAEFGYDLEKAWCNRDVQKVIANAREADKTKSGPSSYYSGFEELAEFSLNKDGKNCGDIDEE